MFNGIIFNHGETKIDKRVKVNLFIKSGISIKYKDLEFLFLVMACVTLISYKNKTWNFIYLKKP